MGSRAKRRRERRARRETAAQRANRRWSRWDDAAQNVTCYVPDNVRSVGPLEPLAGLPPYLGPVMRESFLGIVSVFATPAEVIIDHPPCRLLAVETDDPRVFRAEQLQLRKGRDES